MIDVNQLTELISAFRVETEKESISPETVGKILQDITDLLATASTDAERQILDDWKAMLSQFYVVYDVADANMPDPQNMFLRLKARNLGNGNSYSSSVPIAGATDMKAGAMTATHVQTIMALQAAVSQLRSSVTSLQTASSQHGNQLFIIQAAGYVVTGIAQGNPHSSRVNLRITQHDVRTGEDFVFDGSTYLTGATNEKAGVMTAQQCNALNVAKTDITALQSAMRKVQGAGCVVDGATVFHIATDRIGIMLFGYNLATGEREVELQQLYLSAASEYGAGVMTARQVKRLNELYQAVFGSSNNATSFFNFGIEIGEGKRELFLKHAVKLVELGYVPYLFRYSRKRNRKIDNEGIKGHGDLRKGWNVVGKGETIQIGNAEHGAVPERGEVLCRRQIRRSHGYKVCAIRQEPNQPAREDKQRVPAAQGALAVRHRLRLVPCGQAGTARQDTPCHAYCAVPHRQRAVPQRRLPLGVRAITAQKK